MDPYRFSELNDMHWREFEGKDADMLDDELEELNEELEELQEKIAYVELMIKWEREPEEGLEHD